jgi:putative hydrolase of the HAD superfamily
MTAAMTPIAGPETLEAALASESHIAFDLDGTLYDPRDFERPALASVADWLRDRSGRALDGLTRALWSRRESNRHRVGLFDETLAQFGLPVAWGEECARLFHEYPAAELMGADSLKGLLTNLRSDRRRLALVSNGYPEVQQRKLYQLGLAELFDVCVICDPRVPEQLKPSRWAWSRLADWRGAYPATYVGDDPVDAAFATAGGASYVYFSFRNPMHEN